MTGVEVISWDEVALGPGLLMISVCFKIKTSLIICLPVCSFLFWGTSFTTVTCRKPQAPIQNSFLQPTLQVLHVIRKPETTHLKQDSEPNLQLVSSWKDQTRPVRAVMDPILDILFPYYHAKNQAQGWRLMQIKHTSMKKHVPLIGSTCQAPCISPSLHAQTSHLSCFSPFQNISWPQFREQPGIPLTKAVSLNPGHELAINSVSTILGSMSVSSHESQRTLRSVPLTQVKNSYLI